MTDVVGQIFARAAVCPEAMAIVDTDGTETTYAALRRRALAIAHGLRAAGLAPGDGVLFSLPNSAVATTTFLGVLAAGGTVIMAETAVAPHLLEARLRLTRPRWLIAESAAYLAGGQPDLRPALGLPGLRSVYKGRWQPGVPRGALALRDLASGPAGELAAGNDPRAPALVVFTSGTTANPKGVVHTRKSLTAMAAMLAGSLPLRPGDVLHADSIVLGLPALVAGAATSLPAPSAGPRRFADELAERAVTHAFSVPVHLAAVLDAVPRLPDRLRHLLLGAAPVTTAVLRRAVAAAPNAEVRAIYGMTEAIPIAFADARDKLAHSAAGNQGDLLGTPVAGTQVRVAADGELMVSGPNVCRGYLGQEPLTEVPTGDLGRLDERNRIILLGRKKDMIIRGSYNIYPGLYEPLIAQLPGVSVAAMVGLPDPVTEDESVGLAVVADGSVAPDALPRLLRRRLPEIIDAEALPDRIVVLPELPCSGRSHKLDRPALRALVMGVRP